MHGFVNTKMHNSRGSIKAEGEPQKRLYNVSDLRSDTGIWLHRAEISRDAAHDIGHRRIW
jgi:hypothetical protein